MPSEPIQVHIFSPQIIKFTCFLKSSANATPLRRNTTPFWGQGAASTHPVPWHHLLEVKCLCASRDSWQRWVLHYGIGNMQPVKQQLVRSCSCHWRNVFKNVFMCCLLDHSLTQLLMVIGQRPSKRCVLCFRSWRASVPESGPGDHGWEVASCVIVSFLLQPSPARDQLSVVYNFLTK